MPELVEVQLDGRRRWVLEADVDALQKAQDPTLVRLLPPRDPFLNGDALLDPAHAREVRRPVGGPGTILVDGDLVGTWRHRRRGRTLQIELRPFEPLPRGRDEEIEQQAHLVADARGARDAAVVAR